MRSTHRTLPVLGLAATALAFLAGCPDDQINFHDDLDMVFDFKPFDPLHPPPDDLHLPYVVGASFRMYAFRDHDKMNLSNAVPESQDPRVFDIWDPIATESQVDFRCQALEPGTTEIVVWRGTMHGARWGRTVVEVARPAEAELTFAGPLFIDASRSEYRVRGPVNVLVGGTATFLVEYVDADGRRLYGNDVLEVVPGDAGIEAHPAQTWLFEDREWLVMSPLTAGTHTLTLKVDGRTIGTVTVNAVTEDAVNFIELRPENESGHHDGDFLAVLALGYTVDGDPIYGIEFNWEIDGFPKAGEGDLYKYEYDRSESARLEAAFEGKSQKTTIHSDYGSGWVSSTNHIGCTAGTRSAGWTPVALVLLPLAALALRRRRVASVRTDVGRGP